MPFNANASTSQMSAGGGGRTRNGFSQTQGSLNGGAVNQTNVMNETGTTVLGGAGASGEPTATEFVEVLLPGNPAPHRLQVAVRRSCSCCVTSTIF